MKSWIAVLMMLLCSACGDDSGDGAGGSDAGDAGDSAGEASVWACTCHGAQEVDGGAPLTSTEPITRCSAGDPERDLSERYDAAARAAGPEYSGYCDGCTDTGEACEPEDGGE